MKKIAVVHPSSVFNDVVSTSVKRLIENETKEEVLVLKYNNPKEIYDAFEEFKSIYSEFGEPEKRVFDVVYSKHNFENMEGTGTASALNKMAEEGFSGHVGIFGLNENERKNYNVDIEYSLDGSIPDALFGIRKHLKSIYS